MERIDAYRRRLKREKEKNDLKCEKKLKIFVLASCYFNTSVL